VRLVLPSTSAVDHSFRSPIEGQEGAASGNMYGEMYSVDGRLVKTFNGDKTVWNTVSLYNKTPSMVVILYWCMSIHSDQRMDLSEASIIKLMHVCKNASFMNIVRMNIFQSHLWIELHVNVVSRYICTTQKDFFSIDDLMKAGNRNFIDVYSTFNWLCKHQ
jgi:hypothetical protein